MTSWRVSRDFVCEFLTQDTRRHPRQGQLLVERFFSGLKTERIWQRDYANHTEAMTDIADYIASFYNSVRLHSKVGNLPPNAFEQQSAIKQLTVVSEKT